MSVQNFMPIHEIVAEIFESGPKVVDRPTDKQKV